MANLATPSLACARVCQSQAGLIGREKIGRRYFDSDYSAGREQPDYDECDRLRKT
jgi:hypothetical protein